MDLPEGVLIKADEFIVQKMLLVHVAAMTYVAITYIPGSIAGKKFSQAKARSGLGNKVRIELIRTPSEFDVLVVQGPNDTPLSSQEEDDL